MAGNIYTSDEYTKRLEQEKKDEQLKSLGVLAATAGIGYVGINAANNSDTARDFFSSLPGANRYREKDTLSYHSAIAKRSDPVDLRSLYNNQSVGKSLQSIVASAEELSPSSILKTLQGSNFVEPFIDVSPDLKTTPVHITPDSISAYQDLYAAQMNAQSQGRRRLTSTDLSRGFFLHEGTLYAVKPDGSVDFVDPVLKNAKLVTSNIQIGEHFSPNKVLEKYANIYGVNLNRRNYQDSSSVVIGGASSVGFKKDWIRSYVRYSMEIGYKSLDNPVAGVEELLEAAGLGETNLFKNKTYNKIKDKLNINLGTQGDYTLSTRDSLKLVGKNLAVKSAVGYVGYNAVNSMLSALTPESSVWNNGIISGLTANYASLRVGAAELLADPFQSYKENQEAAATGSTSLTTLIGLPAVGGFAGASFEYYKRLYNSNRIGIEAASALSEEKVGFGIFDRPFKAIGLKDTTPMKSRAITGGIIGGALTLPFLPGALIGESSEDLKKKYSGEELVENRTNAGWVMGGGKFEGDNVKNFQASRVASTLLNIKNTVRYGDNETKRSLDPILHPFKYIANPYRYEEMHTDDMPYPVWAMDVNYGSFLGKAFQGTIGEIIKPTVVNDEFLKQIKEEREAIAEQAVLDQEGSGNGVFGTSGLSASKSTTVYDVPLQVRPKERSLINNGMMIAPESPSVNPTQLAAANTAATLGDFTGLKGFTTSLSLNAMGFAPEEAPLQLARSGSSTSAAQDLREANVGDLLGLGEFVRRLVPHTASSVREDINPMKNSIAPNWMPSDSSRYYNNFSLGNYWDKVDNGEMRLPGVGFNLLNPELGDMNPDDYPLVYQYKALSDTAYASPEHLAMKDILLKQVKDKKLNKDETDIFFETLSQEQRKAQKREFTEYKTDEEKSKFSIGQRALNAIWEPLTHNSESVLEPLTPIRPASKFIHARSAIEDYEKTQIQGPDTAIWTNPYSHFIKPTINRVAGLLPGTQMSSEAMERDSVEEYFDKLEYLKARKEGNTNAALRTVIGSTFGGIYNTETMNKFKAGLSDDQRMYVDAFAKETDQAKRRKILDMLPSDVGVAYQSIWENLAIAEEAKKKGIDPTEALAAHYTNNTDRFKKAAKGTTNEFGTTPRNPDDKFEAKREERLRAADKMAKEYIEGVTGMPSQDWLGWDPRLTVDDIKLRTLTMGKADVFRYGYWNSDLQRNKRIVALDDEKEVVTDYDIIRNNLAEQQKVKNRMESNLFQNGFIARRIELTPASRNEIVIREN